MGEEEEAGACLDHHGEGADGGGQLPVTFMVDDEGERENTTSPNGVIMMSWHEGGRNNILLGLPVRYPQAVIGSCQKRCY